MNTVYTKARKRFGVEYPATATEYAYFIKDGVLTVVRDLSKYGKGISNPNTFRVGDTAEYDSYNLHYTGRITKITDKTVTIVAYPDTRMQKTHRLDMHEFCWRNWDFDAERIEKYNQNEMMYI